MPIDEALTIARQISEALEAAHEQGIVHRDLKPANIKITPDGMVKVLDFGLAKVAHAARTLPAGHISALAHDHDARHDDRRGHHARPGRHMSPEQAKGRAANKRSDIWAFGCVLYEMLTGRRAMMATTSPRCWARWSASSRTGTRCRPTCRSRSVRCCTAVSSRIAVSGSPTSRRHLVLQGTDRDVAITPDGSRVVYRGNNKLLVRALNQLEPMVLSGLDAPRGVFISPDRGLDSVFRGEHIEESGNAWQVANKSVTVARCAARWINRGPDGTIIFATNTP